MEKKKGRRDFLSELNKEGEMELERGREGSLRREKEEEEMWVLVFERLKGKKKWDLAIDDEESMFSSSRRVSFLGFSNGLGG
ncbi:Uncharacterized protein TCM_004975 [Theobroma cacao]|uniref:Uncharacterized protein n=1 Tax=Theobroma cacao TaxID=3641 RepID=A0A061DRQ1_THECC|nr:Uncharacterized protein TCM_004975 [Theobroma cacao]